MTPSDEVQYPIARLALVALTLIATIVLFFYSIRLAPRRKDPARTAFTYLKVAFAVFTVSVTCVLRHLPRPQA
jgi:hypothetical protein